MASAGQANALSTYFIQKYEERYGEKPIINRNKARWSWDNMLQDMSPKAIKELIDFYMGANSAKSHTLDNLFYNYDKILQSMRDYDLDRADRKRMMEETKERTRKYLERRDKIIKENSDK